MKNLRSVGGLVAISALLSCATAINNDSPVSEPPGSESGSDAGGGAGLGAMAGSPAGGSPQVAGSPGTAGKSDGGKAGGGSSAGSGAGGKGGGTAGSTGKGGGGGTVGTGGASGSSTGGKAGTGSSGSAGGSVGGSTGTAGGPSTGLCDNPVDLPGGPQGNTGNFQTLEAKCFRTKSTFNNVGCSNFDGRTLKINGVVTKCGGSGTFAPTPDGYTYLDASAGTNLSASIYWYTS